MTPAITESGAGGARGWRWGRREVAERCEEVQRRGAAGKVVVAVGQQVGQHQRRLRAGGVKGQGAGAGRDGLAGRHVLQHVARAPEARAGVGAELNVIDPNDPAVPSALQAAGMWSYTAVARLLEERGARAEANGR